MNEAERRWARCLEAVHHQMSPQDAQAFAAERARDPELARDWAEAVRLDQRLSDLLAASAWSEQEVADRVERLFDQAHVAAEPVRAEPPRARPWTWLWVPAAAAAAWALWLILAGGPASAPDWPPAQLVASLQRGAEAPGQVLDDAAVQRLDDRLRQAVEAEWARQPTRGGTQPRLARAYHDLVGPAFRIEVTVTAAGPAAQPRTVERLFADAAEFEAGVPELARAITAAGNGPP